MVFILIIFPVVGSYKLLIPLGLFAQVIICKFPKASPLIPLGTGLAALGSGDVNTLSQSLIVAFDTTVVGIGSGALAYIISKIRNRWYEEYLSNLDVLSDAVLDFMSKH